MLFFRSKVRSIIFLIFALLMLTGKGSLYLTPIEQISTPHLFSLSDWETRNIFDKWLYAVKVKFNTSDVLVDDDHFVYDHLEIVNAAENTVSTLFGDETEANLLSDSDIKFVRNSLEAIIERKVSETLREEGIGYFQPLGMAKVHFPPVDITIQPTPKLLVISPRNRIDLIETVLLKTDMTTDEMEALEDLVAEKFDLSALILNLGGIATYPSILPPNKSLESLLVVTAHEWLHHYLFFKPLGRKYWADANMTSINETVANIFGAEIGVKTYGKFQKPVISIEKEKSYDIMAGFNFREELHETRTGVDDLLNQGHIQLAELYMEERRRFINDNGYYIRRLNQAYFAFNGTYADHPASVSPIGSQLELIRNSSDSLADFIDKVSQISDYAEFLDLVDSHG